MNHGIPAFLARAALCAVVVLAGGCASSGPVAPESVTMEILSLPRGCVVEMNGEYLGSTPIKVDVPSTPEGRWKGAPGFTHVIAVSTPNNRAVETRKWRAGDPVPRRVLFRPPYAQYAGATP
jgi:hypothetical protein